MHMEQPGQKVALGNCQSSRKKEILASAVLGEVSAVGQKIQQKTVGLEALSPSTAAEDMSEPRQPSLSVVFSLPGMLLGDRYGLVVGTVVWRVSAGSRKESVTLISLDDREVSRGNANNTTGARKPWSKHGIIQ